MQSEIILMKVVVKLVWSLKEKSVNRFADEERDKVISTAESCVQFLCTSSNNDKLSLTNPINCCYAVFTELSQAKLP